MTYLELVNAVLRRLREEQASTVAESDYTRLIGDFVNDAKRMCEDAWDWSSLRSTVTFDTVVGTKEYTLTSTGHRTEIKEVYETDTENAVDFKVTGKDSNGDIKIKLKRAPTEVKELTFEIINRNPDLSADADEVKIPTAPIVQYAYSFALRERGETGGQSASEQSAFARQDLTNAIALDASLYETETTWTMV